MGIDLGLTNFLVASDGERVKPLKDASWSEFTRQLEYKAKWYGRTIVNIYPWSPSNQICSNCGTVTGKKPLYIRK